MKLTGISQKAFLDRYSLKDKKGNPVEKTPDEMWKRIAAAVAAKEDKKVQKKWEQEFYEAMEDLLPFFLNFFTFLLPYLQITIPLCIIVRISYVWKYQFPI